MTSNSNRRESSWNGTFILYVRQWSMGLGGWTSEKTPIGTKVAYEHPTRPKWLWRIIIGFKTQGDTAVALAKPMT